MILRTDLRILEQLLNVRILFTFIAFVAMRFRMGCVYVSIYKDVSLLITLSRYFFRSVKKILPDHDAVS